MADVQLTPEDQELAAAQEVLRRAQQRKADAEQAARLAAQAALTKRLADEQERLARLKADAEEADRRAVKRRAAEAEAVRQADAARAAETRRLEQEVEKHNEEIRREAERKEKVRKVIEAAHQAEIDAANLEASLRQANTPREEQKPITLISPSHPLSRLFGNGAVEPAQPHSLSTEENAALQAKRDREKAVTTEPARKVHPCVDTATSRELEALLRPILGQVNTQRCDSLSSQWSCGALLNAARQVADQYRVKPTGHDAMLSAIEQLLESQQ